MKKAIFKSISIIVIISHLITVCFKDVGFAEETKASVSSNSASATSTASSQSESSEPVNPPSASEPPSKAVDAEPPIPLDQIGGIGNFNSRPVQVDYFTGQASFSIPIIVPQGRAGMQPQIALSYSSGSGNGIAGVGWSLNMDSVQRSTKRGVPKYNDITDIFIFSSSGNAQELVNISGNEYRSKIEGSFLKIEHLDSKWVATDKTGKKYYFGVNENARQITPKGSFSWYLTEVVDINNNSLNIEYLKDNGQIYPSLVTYGINCIEFVYEDRMDIHFSYITGARVANNKRLKEIIIKTNNTLVRKYVLEYKLSASTNRSLLTSVIFYGSEDSSTQPPLIFNYKDELPNFASMSYWPGLTGSYRHIRRSTTGADSYVQLAYDLFDINGDGLLDRVVKKGDDDTTLLIQLNNGSGFGSYNNWAGLTTGNVVRSTYRNGVWDETVRDTVDLNGDGLPDKIYGFNMANWRVQLNNGQGFASQRNWNGIEGGRLNIRVTKTFSPGNWQVDKGLVTDLIDMNGDGLVDRVIYNPGNDYLKVQLNNGNGFEPYVLWGPIQTSDSNFKGWVNYSKYYGNLDVVNLRDMNGDGLPDRVEADGTSVWQVQFNNGIGFEPPVAWVGVNRVGGAANYYRMIRYSVTQGSEYLTNIELIDMNGDNLPDRIIHSLDSTSIMKVQFNNGNGFQPPVDWGPIYGDINRIRYINSNSQTYADIMDINGDGLPDKVYIPGPNVTNWRVQLNTGFPTDALLSVDNGLGGVTEITYNPSTKYDNTGEDNKSDLPFPVPVVSSVTYSDSKGSSYTTNYFYRDGLYSWQQREFRGFGYVKVTDAENTSNESYFHQDDIFKGRLYKQEVKDATGALYSKTENTWYNDQRTDGTNFVFLQQTDSYLYEGKPEPKHTRVRFLYDNYGNPWTVYSDGEVDVLGDEKTQCTNYVYNESQWLLSFPRYTCLFDANNNVVSEKYFYYDNHSNPEDIPVKGLLTKEEATIFNPPAKSGVKSGNTVVAQYAYDVYGNLITSTDSRGNSVNTAYDTVASTFPVRVVNSLGQNIQMTYYGINESGSKAGVSGFGLPGQPKATIDTNSQQTYQIYDALGRVVKVIGPNDTEDSPGVIYEYDLSAQPIKITKKVKDDSGGSIKYLTTYEFYDGLGRLIESKSPAEADPLTGGARQIVSGIVTYDQRGQVKEKYLPYFVPASADYVAPTYETPHVSFTYDALGRVVQVTNPDGSYSSVTYDQFKKTTTDENGHYRTEYYDAYSRIIKVEENNSGQIYTTRYEYDTLGNLTKTIDDKGNVTQIWYDSLGRKIKMDDPDMGVWLYEYDSAGNLTKQTDNKGGVLTFEYDSLNRLIRKLIGAQVLATYYYDDLTKPNCVGRLSKITDQSGSTEFFYDNLGREIKSTKTIGGSQFTVQREYDSLDRLTKLTYPDGSVIQYEYNPQGIEKVYGSSKDVSYVTNINYSPTGQILRIQYGNNTETNYAYNPQTLRLDNIITQSPKGKVQDLSYTFDSVGNVTNIQDYVNSATQSFVYDDLNRLTQASGAYGTYAYQYDSIGNMIYKEGVSMVYGSTALTTSGKPRLPHAVTRFGDTEIDYDLNGNMIKKGSLEYSYDAENRLIKAEDKSSSGEVTLDITLRPGWNFFSLPLEPLDAKATSVLSSIAGKYDQLSRYNPTAKTFEHFINDSRFNQFDSFEYGRGYQIYITSSIDVILTVVGSVPVKAAGASKGTDPKAATEILLKTGLNLIANPKLTEVSVEQGLSPLKLGVDYSRVLYYNKDTSSFQEYSATKKEFSVFKPGVSYFLDCLKDASWVIDNSRPVTTFLYDGDGGRVKKIVGSSSTTYIGSLFEKDQDGKATRHIFAGANRICSIEGSDARYFHSDHLGSSNVTTDASGNQVGLTEFSPYGGVSRQTGTYEPKYKFTGKELDASTGLYFYGARYYDPELGRFISADTFVQNPYDPQSFNRYSYCRNNPINYVDPTGHFFWIIAGAIIGAIIGGAVAAATGGNIGQGFLIGAISGALFNIAGGLPLQGFAHTIGHTIAGAVSGAISGVITGDDIGMNAIIGGISAGASEWLGSNVNFLKPVAEKSIGAFVNNLAKKTFTGAVIGGATSSALGGDFGEGAISGARTAAIAYTCNEALHEGGRQAIEALSADQVPVVPSGDFGRNVGPGGFYDDTGFHLTIGEYETASTSGLSRYKIGLIFGAFDNVKSSMGSVRSVMHEGQSSDGGFASVALMTMKIAQSTASMSKAQLAYYEMQKIEKIRNEKSLFLFNP